MQYFFLLLIFISSLCQAQDSTSNAMLHKSNSKQKLIISCNIGISFPEGGYLPSIISNWNPSNEAYGYSATGFHVDVTGIYAPSTSAGLAVKIGADINPTGNAYSGYTSGPANILSQYLAGFYLSIHPKQANFNVYFLGLGGLVIANVTNHENTFSNVGIYEISGYAVPGLGIGPALYGGIGISSKMNKRMDFNISAGYLASSLNFSNTAQTTYTSGGPLYPPQMTTSISKSPMTMTAEILQINLGVGFHL